MGRRQTIDREHVLEVAEQIVASQGAAALTIDAVAKAAGITKGGVQSCFGTKEAMIAAMLKRWMSDDDRRFAEAAGSNPALVDRILAHVETTHQHDDAGHARAASLLAVLLQTPEHLADVRRWYERRTEGLQTDDAEARYARLAFLATEGAFLLRFLGLLSIDQETWNNIFVDIRKLIPPGQ
jgi:AcrR family transcriptional regulator